MPERSIALWLLEREARALLARLARVKPFVLNETMVPAAALTPPAQMAIERYLNTGRKRLRGLVDDYLLWLHGPQGSAATPAEAQRRLTFLRLRFTAVVSQFELFAEVVTQRSEHETGVWLSGLDVVAADALELPGFYEAPPVACYLARGPGGAIRRVRTRLPGGGDNPVALIRVPRERMIGSGIASSLAHEVGHQAASLLDLVNSFRPALRSLQRTSRSDHIVWQLWERWISEIMADFWAIAKVGIASTLGLIAIVSLPRVFVFRSNMDDPHPFPWIRVKLSCAIGKELYPHRQWDEVSRIWETYYPIDGLDQRARTLLGKLQDSMGAFVSLLTRHRPRALRGITVAQALDTAERQPERLGALWRSWRASPALLPVELRTAPPSLAFAVLGQARADDRVSPEDESDILGELLAHWAMNSTLDISAYCATRPRRMAERRPA